MRSDEAGIINWRVFDSTGYILFNGHILSAVCWSLVIFNIVLTLGFPLLFAGGKKKPLKQPKKQGANFEDVSQPKLVYMNIINCMSKYYIPKMLQHPLEVKLCDSSWWHPELLAQMIDMTLVLADCFSHINVNNFIRCEWCIRLWRNGDGWVSTVNLCLTIHIKDGLRSKSVFKRWVVSETSQSVLTLTVVILSCCLQFWLFLLWWYLALDHFQIGCVLFSMLFRRVSSNVSYTCIIF